HECIGFDTVIAYESCAIPFQTVEKTSTPSNCGLGNSELEIKYARNAHTKMILLSGGRGIAGRQILHRLSGEVKDVIPVMGIQAQPQPLTTAFGYNAVWDSSEPRIPNGSVRIGADTLH